MLTITQRDDFFAIEFHPPLLHAVASRLHRPPSPLEKFAEHFDASRLIGLGYEFFAMKKREAERCSDMRHIAEAFTGDPETPLSDVLDVLHGHREISRNAAADAGVGVSPSSSREREADLNSLANAEQLAEAIRERQTMAASITGDPASSIGAVTEVITERERELSEASRAHAGLGDALRRLGVTPGDTIEQRVSQLAEHATIGLDVADVRATIIDALQLPPETEMSVVMRHVRQFPRMGNDIYAKVCEALKTEARSWPELLAHMAKLAGSDHG